MMFLIFLGWVALFIVVLLSKKFAIALALALIGWALWRTFKDDAEYSMSDKKKREKYDREERQKKWDDYYGYR